MTKSRDHPSTPSSSPSLTKMKGSSTNPDQKGNYPAVFPQSIPSPLWGNHNETICNITSSSEPSSFWSTGLKATLGATIALYLLNQAHLLPTPLSAIVSKVLFYPTLPITVGKRLGKWSTVIDETVIMGGAPLDIAHLPEKLYQQFKIRGVINMCQEYRGPIHTYERFGIQQLWLPTIDHCEPSIHHIEDAIQFIQQYAKKHERVYVHCRAGHGRSAAIVLAWLLYKDPYQDRQLLNERLCQLRNVRTTLWKQPNIIEYHTRLLHKQSLSQSNRNENNNGNEDDNGSSTAAGGGVGDSNRDANINHVNTVSPPWC